MAMARKTAAILSIFLPGLGQLLMGRLVRGAIFLVGVGFCLDVALVARSSIHLAAAARHTLTFGPLTIAALLWIYGILDAFQLARPDAADAAERRERHFRQGLTHFLRDEWDEAQAEFARAVELDRDDVDARYYLAVTCREAGDTRRARRAFRQCRELDEQNKWSAEIDRELKTL